MKVFVYRNLTKGVFSIRHNNRVIAHARRFIIKDAVFKVSEAGRQRVLRERCKNVHAGIVGGILACDSRGCDRRSALLEWGDDGNLMHEELRYEGINVRYDPYEADHFFVVGSRRPIYNARYVYGAIEPVVNIPFIQAMED